MRTLFLATTSDVLSDALVRLAGNDFHIAVSHNGCEALAQLQEVTPDALILDMLLPYLDGLRLLQALGDHRPPVILALTTSISPAEQVLAWKLGVLMVVMKPCRPEVVMGHLNHLLELHDSSKILADDPQTVVARILRRFSLPEHRDGFEYLRIGTPLYMADRCQSLTKELYPAIAQLCGCDDGKLIERAIREVLEDGWKSRNTALWRWYFPCLEHRPSNKLFLATVVRMIEEESARFQRR